MNKKSFLWVFAAVITGIALMNFSNGPAAGGANATGSPGSGSCGAGGCHGMVNTADLSISILDAGSQAVTEYAPGEVYSITYTISNSTISPMSPRWGMQSAVLDGSDAQAGTLANASSNLNIVPLNGVDYVEHGPSSSDSVFTVEWTAPSAGTGDVTIYANGVAANNNGASSSDAFAAGTPITLTEKMDSIIDTTSIYDRAFDARYKLYPNPVQANLVVESPSEGTLEVFSLAGQLVLTADVANGINSIDATAIETGLYLATVRDADGTIVSRTKLIRE